MEAERWREIQELYHKALRKPADQRATVIQEACAGDLSLQKEVESLLAEEERTGGFLSTPALDVAAKAVARDYGRTGGEVSLSESMIGSTFSHYRILKKLGSGGMGVVYKAEDVKLSRFVALKFLPRAFAENPQAVERFEREARAASAADHANICTIYEFGEQGGQPFIAMQFLEGQTMRERIAGQKLKTDELLDLGIQIAAGLEAAHALGIVHRDIKPANIFVTARGEAKILDFGIAKLVPTGRAPNGANSRMEGATDGAPDNDSLTRTGAVIGTAEYMSPEQARGETLDIRTDLYSFGAVLYEMATGRAPFKGASVAEILGQILHVSPPPVCELNPHLPAAFEAVVHKALEKDSALRYQHASEMQADLKRLRRDTESGRVQSRAVTGASRGMKPAMLHGRLALLLGIALAVVLLAAAGWIIFRSQRKRGFAPTVQLTNFTDSATSPALSPDGRMLAFIRGENTFVGPGQIYVKVLPDGEPVQLTHDNQSKMSPQFSADASRIDYTVSPPFDTWEVPVLGGEPRLMLANASGLTWIDRQHLLFSEIKTGLHMGVVTSTESRAEERSVYWPPRERGMAHRSYLSPDGKWVLLVEMDNDGWLPCRLAPFDGSSSGTRVGPQGAACTGAAWSPDGRWMYLSSDAGGLFHIWRQRFPNGEPEQVTSGATDEQGIAITPDGKSIVTSMGLESGDVWLHDSNGERQISSRGFARTPTLSPDGSKAFYLVSATAAMNSFASGELWVSNLRTGSTEHLLPGLMITGYDISPDGSRIAFASADGQGKSHLWIAGMMNRFPPRQIPSDTSDDLPLFGPGGYIYYRGAQGGLNFAFRVKDDGSAREKIWPGPIIGILAISPDGKWFTGGAPIQDGDTSYGVWAFPLNGGTPVELSPGYCPAGWDRSGRQFIIRIPSEHNRFNPEQTLVFPLPPGKDLPPLENLNLVAPIDPAKLRGVKVINAAVEFGPDTSTYVFTRTSVHRNLYSIPIP